MRSDEHINRILYYLHLHAHFGTWMDICFDKVWIYDVCVMISDELLI